MSARSNASRPPARAPRRLDHGARRVDADDARGTGGREHVSAVPRAASRVEHPPAGRQPAGPLVARKVLGREQLLAHRLGDEPLGNVRG